jgi:hypothetical protein
MHVVLMNVKKTGKCMDPTILLCCHCALAKRVTGRGFVIELDIIDHGRMQGRIKLNILKLE